MTKKSGIYRIDGPNDRFYIGSAQNISRRWIEHKRDLRKEAHINPRLQAAWNKYGESAFTFHIVELVDDVEDLLEREQFWLDTLNAVERGYNVLPTAGSNLGWKPSEETKKRMSEAHKGRKHGPMSEEQKALISAALSGRKLSEETKKKMGDARRGKPRPAHVAEAVSKAMKNRKFSEEHREKLAAAKRGRKQSREHVEKRAAARKKNREEKLLKQSLVLDA